MTYRLAIYLGAAVVIVLGILGYGHSRYLKGERAAEARMQVKVDEANKRTEAAEQLARKVTEDSGHEIEQLRQTRDAEFARATRDIRPVRLCRAGSGGQVPAASSPAPTAHRTLAGQPDVPLSTLPPDRPAPPVSDDIGPGLIDLMASCQRDRDSFVAWQAWYREQAAVR
jgi:hypothetical protein